MRQSFLPFAFPHIGQEEVDEVLTCLQSGWLTTGHKVRRLETEFADYVGVKHAIAVNSCTGALHLGLEAVGVGPGDEVITTPMTFTATAAVIEHLGATPVFVDCDPRSLNLSVCGIEGKLTKRTKAILPVHFGGQACDMAPMMELAATHGLAIVEDAAHALPTRYRGQMVGAIGDITCFSFYATKSVTTGEGGMLTTNDDRHAERVRLMSLHGMSRDAWKRFTQNGTWSYDILAPGFKYNLTDIAASIGIPQLRKSDAFHRRRIEIARAYNQAFAEVAGVERPFACNENDHSWHLYTIRIDAETLGVNRDEFIRSLYARNIGCSVHFIPLHIQPYYRERYGFKPWDFPNAMAAFQGLVSLPIYPRMTDDDVHDVIEAVTDVVAQRQR